jgi:site-specific recombinase XerD
MNQFLLYSQPTIGGMEKGRPYVYFSHVLSKQKYRYYSGVVFGMRSARGLSTKELDIYFRTLQQAIILKLNEGWNPDDDKQTANKVEKDNKPLKTYGSSLCDYIEKADYSAKHKYALRWYWGELLKFGGALNIDDIAQSDIQVHLMNRYATTNTSYNTAKRYYKCIFNLLMQLGFIEVNPVVGVKSKKAVASINEAFDKVELKALMDYLKLNDQVLYRVALLMYTTFMRPHQEIRLLQVKFIHFDDCLLVLPPRFTKNGKQATIPLQDSVLEEFKFVKEMNPEDYIFGKVNPDYFATRWGKRVKTKYPLKPNQTLYSIRHTAAVEMYRKTKDVALIQRMMHHSSMEVTIGYLRSLNCTLTVVSADMYPSL